MSSNEEVMTDKPVVTVRKTNWFVRVLLFFLCLFLGGLVAYRFFTLTPLGDLSPGVIIVLVLVVVLVLSESFDKFSVGKLLTLSREAVKKDIELTEIKRENAELRSQIVSVATTINQRQSSTNIISTPTDIARMFRVTTAPEEEAREKRSEEISQQQVSEQPARTRPDRRAVEQRALDRFVADNNFAQFLLVRDVKLQSQIDVFDPIGLFSPLFDAYLNMFTSEAFIEVESSARYVFSLNRDRLYVKLSKLYHYRAAKKSDVHLYLLLVSLPGEIDQSRSSTRLLNEFQPAISSGLLRIVELNLTEAEVAGMPNEMPPPLPPRIR